MPHHQPDFSNQTWVDSSDAEEYCSSNSDNPLCELVTTYYEYDMILAPNVVFLALFILSFIGFVGVWALTRRGTAFNLAMLIGVLLEIIGYAGRIMSHGNPWGESGFLMQIICLTIAPAFLAAGMYLCLRRIVSAFGPENSRLPPEYYTRIFIPCDVLSLVLQAAGGGVASGAAHDDRSSKPGANIMVGGLSFQVFTLFCFIIASADFALRTHRRHRALGEAALDQRPAAMAVRNSRRFKCFLVALSIAVVCILWRSAYRVAELSQGWEGPLMGNQGMFIGFEGVLVIVAVLVLNVFHPGWCMRELLEADDGGLKGLWWTRKRKVIEANKSGSLSDAEGKGPPGQGMTVRRKDRGKGQEWTR